jgi:hypothetical protein
MSAVDLGGSNYKLSAVKSGTVDVSGSFVRSRQDPKTWPKGSNNNCALQAADVLLHDSPAEVKSKCRALDTCTCTYTVTDLNLAAGVCHVLWHVIIHEMYLRSIHRGTDASTCWLGERYDNQR